MIKIDLKNYLKSIVNFNNQELEEGIDFFAKNVLKKGEYYLEQGQQARRISFVEKGLFRLFYHLDGEEKIMLFFSEGQLMTDYFGFLTNTPSIRPIQALEDSLIYSIEKEQLTKLYDQSKNWERLGRKLSESAYVTSVLRANRLLHDDYQTRVNTFLQENQSLIQRIPQYMIASYLHMTPETLSRVKRNLMDSKNPRVTIHPIP